MSVGGGSRRASMDKTVARLNIEHFRKKLAVETDEARRQTLMRLLAEEEVKLQSLITPGLERKAQA
jgi:hypothetical protein